MSHPEIRRLLRKLRRSINSTLPTSAAPPARWFDLRRQGNGAELEERYVDADRLYKQALVIAFEHAVHFDYEMVNLRDLGRLYTKVKAPGLIGTSMIAIWESCRRAAKSAERNCFDAAAKRLHERSRIFALDFLSPIYRAVSTLDLAEFSSIADVTMSSRYEEAEERKRLESSYLAEFESLNLSEEDMAEAMRIYKDRDSFDLPSLKYIDKMTRPLSDEELTPSDPSELGDLLLVEEYFGLNQLWQLFDPSGEQYKPENYSKYPECPGCFTRDRVVPIAYGTRVAGQSPIPVVMGGVFHSSIRQWNCRRCAWSFGKVAHYSSENPYIAALPSETK